MVYLCVLAQTPLVVGVGFYTNDLVRPYSSNPLCFGVNKRICG